VTPVVVTVAGHDLSAIAMLALGGSLPVVLAGGLIIRLARSWSITVSMVALVLIPTLATLAGVFSASRFMTEGTFHTVAVVLVVVAVVTLPAAVMLARYQARRIVWEKDIQDAERGQSSPADVSGDEVRVQAKQIECESVRLSEMVDDLFEMAKINAGAVNAPYERVALDEVVDDVISAHRIAAERAGVALDVDIPATPVRAIGSARALVRVLSNLVANAIAHTPAGGSVRLAIGSDAEGAWARVDDTGVGIDAADLPRVFDVAYRGSNHRVPRADSSLPSGSGLGLAIAAGLVRAHRGSLSAHNLDHGARFEVRLPIAAE
jgi:signal transduction histidine kinase